MCAIISRLPTLDGEVLTIPVVYVAKSWHLKLLAGLGQVRVTTQETKMKNYAKTAKNNSIERDPSCSAYCAPHVLKLGTDDSADVAIPCICIAEEDAEQIKENVSADAHHRISLICRKRDMVGVPAVFVEDIPKIALEAYSKTPGSCTLVWNNPPGFTVTDFHSDIDDTFLVNAALSKRHRQLIYASCRSSDNLAPKRALYLYFRPSSASLARSADLARGIWIIGTKINTAAKSSTGYDVASTQADQEGEHVNGPDRRRWTWGYDTGGIFTPFEGEQLGKFKFKDPKITQTPPQMLQATLARQGMALSDELKQGASPSVSVRRDSVYDGFGDGDGAQDEEMYGAPTLARSMKGANVDGEVYEMPSLAGSKKSTDADADADEDAMLMFSGVDVVVDRADEQQANFDGLKDSVVIINTANLSSGQFASRVARMAQSEVRGIIVAVNSDHQIDALREQLEGAQNHPYMVFMLQSQVDQIISVMDLQLPGSPRVSIIEHPPTINMSANPSCYVRQGTVMPSERSPSLDAQDDERRAQQVAFSISLFFFVATVVVIALTAQTAYRSISLAYNDHPTKKDRVSPRALHQPRSSDEFFAYEFCSADGEPRVLSATCCDGCEGAACIGCIDGSFMSQTCCPMHGDFMLDMQRLVVFITVSAGCLSVINNVLQSMLMGAFKKESFWTEPELYTLMYRQWAPSFMQFAERTHRFLEVSKLPTLELAGNRVPIAPASFGVAKKKTGVLAIIDPVPDRKSFEFSGATGDRAAVNGLYARIDAYQNLSEDAQYVFWADEKQDALSPALGHWVISKRLATGEPDVHTPKGQLKLSTAPGLAGLSKLGWEGDPGLMVTPFSRCVVLKNIGKTANADMPLLECGQGYWLMLDGSLVPPFRKERGPSQKVSVYVPVMNAHESFDFKSVDGKGMLRWVLIPGASRGRHAEPKGQWTHVTLAGLITRYGPVTVYSKTGPDVRAASDGGQLLKNGPNPATWGVERITVGGDGFVVSGSKTKEINGVYQAAPTFCQAADPKELYLTLQASKPLDASASMQWKIVRGITALMETDPDVPVGKNPPVSGWGYSDERGWLTDSVASVVKPFTQALADGDVLDLAYAITFVPPQHAIDFEKQRRAEEEKTGVECAGLAQPNNVFDSAAPVVMITGATDAANGAYTCSELHEVNRSPMILSANGDPSSESGPYLRWVEDPVEMPKSVCLRPKLAQLTGDGDDDGTNDSGEGGGEENPADAKDSSTLIRLPGAPRAWDPSTTVGHWEIYDGKGKKTLAKTEDYGADEPRNLFPETLPLTVTAGPVKANPRPLWMRAVKDVENKKDTWCLDPCTSSEEVSRYMFAMTSRYQSSGVYKRSTAPGEAVWINAHGTRLQLSRGKAKEDPPAWVLFETSETSTDKGVSLIIDVPEDRIVSIDEVPHTGWGKDIAGTFRNEKTKVQARKVASVFEPNGLLSGRFAVVVQRDGIPIEDEVLRMQRLGAAAALVVCSADCYVELKDGLPPVLVGDDPEVGDAVKIPVVGISDASLGLLLSQWKGTTTPLKAKIDDEKSDVTLWQDMIRRQFNSPYDLEHRYTWKRFDQSDEDLSKSGFQRTAHNVPYFNANGFLYTVADPMQGAAYKPGEVMFSRAKNNIIRQELEQRPSNIWTVWFTSWLGVFIGVYSLGSLMFTTFWVKQNAELVCYQCEYETLWVQIRDLALVSIATSGLALIVATANNVLNSSVVASQNGEPPAGPASEEPEVEPQRRTRPWLWLQEHLGIGIGPWTQESSTTTVFASYGASSWKPLVAPLGTADRSGLSEDQRAITGFAIEQAGKSDGIDGKIAVIEVPLPKGSGTVDRVTLEEKLGLDCQMLVYNAQESGAVGAVLYLPKPVEKDEENVARLDIERILNLPAKKSNPGAKVLDDKDGIADFVSSIRVPVVGLTFKDIEVVAGRTNALSEVTAKLHDAPPSKSQRKRLQRGLNSTEKMQIRELKVAIGGTDKKMPTDVKFLSPLPGCTFNYTLVYSLMGQVVEEIEDTVGTESGDDALVGLSTATVAGAIKYDQPYEIFLSVFAHKEHCKDSAEKTWSYRHPLTAPPILRFKLEDDAAAKSADVASVPLELKVTAPACEQPSYLDDIRWVHGVDDRASALAVTMGSQGVDADARELVGMARFRCMTGTDMSAMHQAVYFLARFADGGNSSAGVGAYGFIDNRRENSQDGLHFNGIVAVARKFEQASSYDPKGGTVSLSEAKMIFGKEWPTDDSDWLENQPVLNDSFGGFNGNKAAVKTRGKATKAKLRAIQPQLKAIFEEALAKSVAVAAAKHTKKQAPTIPTRGPHAVVEKLEIARYINKHVFEALMTSVDRMDEFAFTVNDQRVLNWVDALQRLPTFSSTHITVIEFIEHISGLPYGRGAEADDEDEETEAPAPGYPASVQRHVGVAAAPPQGADGGYVSVGDDASDEEEEEPTGFGFGKGATEEAADGDKQEQEEEILGFNTGRSDKQLSGGFSRGGRRGSVMAAKKLLQDKERAATAAPTAVPKEVKKTSDVTYDASTRLSCFQCLCWRFETNYQVLGKAAMLSVEELRWIRNVGIKYYDGAAAELEAFYAGKGPTLCFYRYTPNALDVTAKPEVELPVLPDSLSGVTFMTWSATPGQRRVLSWDDKALDVDMESAHTIKKPWAKTRELEATESGRVFIDRRFDAVHSFSAVSFLKGFGPSHPIVRHFPLVTAVPGAVLSRTASSGTQHVQRRAGSIRQRPPSEGPQSGFAGKAKEQMQQDLEELKETLMDQGFTEKQVQEHEMYKLRSAAFEKATVNRMSTVLGDRGTLVTEDAAHIPTMAENVVSSARKESLTQKRSGYDPRSIQDMGIYQATLAAVAAQKQEEADRIERTATERSVATDAEAKKRHAAAKKQADDAEASLRNRVRAKLKAQMAEENMEAKEREAARREELAREEEARDEARAAAKAALLFAEEAAREAAEAADAEAKEERLAEEEREREAAEQVALILEAAVERDAEAAAEANPSDTEDPDGEGFGDDASDGAPASGDEDAPASGDEDAPAFGDEDAPVSGDESALASGDEGTLASGAAEPESDQDSDGVPDDEDATRRADIAAMEAELAGDSS